jgi:hypothetical protein
MIATYRAALGVAEVAAEYLHLLAYLESEKEEMSVVESVVGMALTYQQPYDVPLKQELGS